ncbi:hypothetical protein DAPPUDRAFT_244717 [Daphnia pulex]|uniref:Vitellogenin domain-containing protein n=1 Tax=Daphnia pulex TaxID=6669 RepID=E9GLM4_DAPPU|nr:hypothetical protein DAPPUDRAFT_244717 [Daphnia pulex]|eukprot:EFX79536.1 hypothetical protein DAPPUDRAFT_244717 [Daphnia pulex]
MNPKVILFLLVLVVADVLTAAAQDENDQMWDYPETESGIVVNYRLVRLSRAAEPGMISSRFSRWLFG